MDGDINVEWPPMKDGKNVMEINTDLTLHESVNKDRLMFWVDLYKDALGDFHKIFL